MTVDYRIGLYAQVFQPEATSDKNILWYFIRQKSISLLKGARIPHGPYPLHF